MIYFVQFSNPHHTSMGKEENILPCLRSRSSSNSNANTNTEGVLFMFFQNRSFDHTIAHFSPASCQTPSVYMVIPHHLSLPMPLNLISHHLALISNLVMPHGTQLFFRHWGPMYRPNSPPTNLHIQANLCLPARSFRMKSNWRQNPSSFLNAWPLVSFEILCHSSPTCPVGR